MQQPGRIGEISVSRTAVVDTDEISNWSMPEANWGSGSASNPGVYVRAGMAGCLAILVKMTADQMDLGLQRVEVDLVMDFDNAADAATPAPLDTRFQIRVETDASQTVLSGLLERSLERDPFFVALRDAQSVQTTINRVWTTDARVRYLGVELEDALAISESVEI